jgi:hypothetical protein
MQRYLAQIALMQLILHPIYQLSLVHYQRLEHFMFFEMRTSWMYLFIIKVRRACNAISLIFTQEITQERSYRHLYGREISKKVIQYIQTLYSGPVIHIITSYKN